MTKKYHIFLTTVQADADKAVYNTCTLIECQEIMLHALASQNTGG